MASNNDTMSRSGAGAHLVRATSAAVLLLVATTVAPSAAAADSLAARVDAIFARYDKPDVPGCAIAVVRNGKIVHERGYGLASIEHRIPIKPDKTVFNIASTSKQFTAASVLLLVRDGQLSLDDDVRKFLPELRDYGHPITIRHLLHHTSGLRDYYTLLELAFVSPVDATTETQTLAAIVRQQALDFVPGTAWGYSSSNYFLLGQIVARVSGKPLRDFARERIFMPLGMRDTRFLARYDEIVAGVATAYSPLPEDGFVVDMSNWMTAGPSGLRTTVEDLARWDANFYTGKVGGTWLPEQLQVRGRLNDGTVIDYARGLVIEDDRGFTSVSHDGGFSGYRAQLLRFPEAKFSAIVLCNAADSAPRELAAKIARVYLADKRHGAASSPPLDMHSDAAAAAPDPARFVGTYWNPRESTVRRIELRQGTLFYVRGANSATALLPAGDGQLRMQGMPQETLLTFAADGTRTFRLSVSGMGVMQGGTSDFIEVQPFDASKCPSNALAGMFRSAELRSEWQLVARDDQIALRDPRGNETVLRPAFNDAFFLDDYLLRFRRDDAGTIAGFSVDAGRALNIGFDRVLASPQL